jgi:transposase InsO family protein
MARSQALSAELARRFGINEKTVRKWRSRRTVEDEPMGRKDRHSSILSAIEGAGRRSARAGSPAVGRCLRRAEGRHLVSDASSLRRCLQRHGISRLPKADREKPKRFKAYEIGYFHLDIAELHYDSGKAYLFVAVDRTSKLVFARKATKLVALGFLKAVPYRIHTVLTDNGIQFVQHDKKAEGGFLAHVFGRVCAEHSIEHRLTKPYYPWTNGQAERTVRAIKDATVRAFHHTSIAGLLRHFRDWLLAYNYSQQLKALRFSTPLEALKLVSLKSGSCSSVHQAMKC